MPLYLTLFRDSFVFFGITEARFLLSNAIVLERLIDLYDWHLRRHIHVCTEICSLNICCLVYFFFFECYLCLHILLVLIIFVVDFEVIFVFEAVSSLFDHLNLLIVHLS